MAETKHEKFLRLAESRVNNLIEQLRILGNLSNTKTYEFSDDEVEKIFNRIEIELKRTKLLFTEAKLNKFKL